MAKARKAAKTQSKLMTIIYGESFTGKSTLAMQLAYFKRPDGKPFRILYLDSESGSIDDYLPELEANGVNLENIYIVYTQSLGEVRYYIDTVKTNSDFYELNEKGEETDDVVVDADGLPFRADAIVVDGSTILNLTTKQGLIEFSKKRNRVKADAANMTGEARLVKIEGSGMELKDYQTVNFKGQDLILDLLASGVHCVVTAREKDETESKMIDGKRETVTTGRKIIDGFKGMDYNAKTVIRTFVDDETDMVCAQIVKDRTHTYKKNEIVEDPQMLAWQKVIDNSVGNKEFTLGNALTKAVDVEQKIYKREILGEAGKPVSEEEAEKEESGVSSSESSSKKDSVQDVKKRISDRIKKLAPPKRQEMKDKLAKEGLPTAFSRLNDLAQLKKIEEILVKKIKEDQEG